MGQYQMPGEHGSRTMLPVNRRDCYVWLCFEIPGRCVQRRCRSIGTVDSRFRYAQAVAPLAGTRCDFVFESLREQPVQVCNRRMVTPHTHSVHAKTQETCQLRFTFASPSQIDQRQTCLGRLVYV